MVMNRPTAFVRCVRVGREAALADDAAVLRERRADCDSAMALAERVEHLLEARQFDLEQGHRAHRVGARKNRAARRERFAQALRQQLRGRHSPVALGIRAGALRIHIAQAIGERIGFRLRGALTASTLTGGIGGRGVRGRRMAEAVARVRHCVGLRCASRQRERTCEREQSFQLMAL